MEIDLFGDGMRIFIDYVIRKTKHNPDYNPHPLIRAFNCAIQGIQKAQEGEIIAGLSQEGTSDAIYEPYIVLLQKNKDGIEVKEIKNLSVNKTVPTDIMIIIFRLQIYLDKIVGDTVNSQQFTNALNHVIPGDVFFDLGNRWVDARDEFKFLLEKRQLKIPNDPKIIEELKRLKHYTPWEEYSSALRALIGPCILSKLGIKKECFVITTPSKYQIEKYKVFDTAMQFLLGKPSEYLNLILKKSR